MNSPMTPGEDRRLAELFRTLNPPLEDEGFGGIVLRRIGRRSWLRRGVLGTAVVIGGVVAVGPLSELAVLLSEGLVVAARSWSDPAWLAQNQALVVLALLAVAWPGAMRLLDR